MNKSQSKPKVFVSLITVIVVMAATVSSMSSYANAVLISSALTNYYTWRFSNNGDRYEY